MTGVSISIHGVWYLLLRNMPEVLPLDRAALAFRASQSLSTTTHTNSTGSGGRIAPQRERVVLRGTSGQIRALRLNVDMV